MKKLQKLTGLLFALMLTSLFASTAFAAQGSVSITAHVYQALTVTQTQAMDFGNIFANSGSPTTANATGGFQVSGEANAAVNIQYPATVTLNGPSSATLTVNITTPSANDTLNGSGSLNKTFDGQVTIDDSTTAGDYTGTATITVTYV